MSPRIDGPTVPVQLPQNDPQAQPNPSTQTPVTPTGSYVLPPTYGPVQAPQPTWTTPPDSGFAASARGQQPQWDLDTDLSKISADVYDPAAGGVGKWNRVDDATLTSAGIDPASLKDSSTGFQAAIYTDGDGRYVVAYAGTEFTSGKDWLNNIQQGLGLKSKAYDQAIALGQQAVKAFGDGNVVFTGHSLGGGEASAAAAVTGQPAVTFNAAGINGNTLSRYGVSLDQASDAAGNGQIRRYNVENDILTNAQQGGLSGLALPDAIGYEITLENPNTIEDPVRAHMSGTVVSAMESRDIKTQQNDNWFEKNVLEHNLFPMGPSVKDIWETGGDVLNKVEDLGGKVLSAINPFD